MLKRSLLLKRIFDILMSCIGLIVFSPIILIISLLIKLDSKGPVIFKQERRGKDGKVFKMYKFRSMVVGAEMAEMGLFNYTNDSRVTRIGRKLRNTSLDELPQLINILKGDMSFVGPRPAVTYELGEFETLNKRYRKRFKVVPGITGLAQVSGRNEIDWDKKVDYDNRYIDLFQKMGIWIDIKILFQTFVKVIKHSDIYEEKLDESLSDKDSAKMMEKLIIKRAHEPD